MIKKMPEISNPKDIFNSNLFWNAEDEPAPIILKAGKEWEWESVKDFFEKNISKFEKGLL